MCNQVTSHPPSSFFPPTNTHYAIFIPCAGLFANFFLYVDHYVLKLQVILSHPQDRPQKIKKLFFLLNMGYLIFTIIFSMWELCCYAFFLYAQHNVLSYRLSYALPERGGGKSMRSSLFPPLPLKSKKKIAIMSTFLLFILYVGAFSYIFLFMHLTIRVGVTDYVVPSPPPPPPPQEKRTKKALTWNKNSKKIPHI